MPTLEQVCKRLFSSPGWFIRCLIGAMLLIVPIAHFFAFGYLYEMMARARRGDVLEFPEWDDWRRMFVNGVPAFVIFVVLGLLPLAVGWLLTIPLRGLDYGAFGYLPMVPALLLAGPLTAASLYQYQKREEYRDAFRLWVLVAMLRSTKARVVVPTFAVLGFVIALRPLMTFTIFIGIAAGWTFLGALFRSIEESRKNSPRAP